MNCPGPDTAVSWLVYDPEETRTAILIVVSVCDVMSWLLDLFVAHYRVESPSEVVHLQLLALAGGVGDIVHLYSLLIIR